MKNIKYIIAGIMLIMLASCAVLSPQFTNENYSYSTCINGYWSEWERGGFNKIKFYNGHFILCSSYSHPSEYYIKVTYNLGSETRKGKWYVYDGTVEYYVGKATDSFPFDEWKYSGSITRPHSKEYRHKKVSPAKIQIQNRPAKDAHKGATFNIFFERNAIGISGI